MPQTVASAETIPTDARHLYDKLEERILDRDQVGASRAYYGLVKAGRPLPEIVKSVESPGSTVPSG